MSIKNIIQMNKSSKSIEKVDLKEPHSKVGDDKKARKYWNIINWNSVACSPSFSSLHSLKIYQAQSDQASCQSLYIPECYLFIPFLIIFDQFSWLYFDRLEQSSTYVDTEITDKLHGCGFHIYLFVDGSAYIPVVTFSSLTILFWHYSVSKLPKM